MNSPLFDNLQLNQIPVSSKTKAKYDKNKKEKTFRRPAARWSSLLQALIVKTPSQCKQSLLQGCRPRNQNPHRMRKGKLWNHAAQIDPSHQRSLPKIQGATPSCRNFKSKSSWDTNSRGRINLDQALLSQRGLGLLLP